MNTLISPISLNERSLRVRILHKALMALGLPVSGKEVVSGRAGEDTLKKVRRLQKKLNLPVDESVLLDDRTALAIVEELKRRDLISASRSFTVTGTVRLQTGEVKKRQRLLAFDLDLRGVAIYRKAKTVGELTKSRGVEFLGETVSNNEGYYSITFYDWQFRQAERKKADVVVFAVEGERIIGSSRLVNTDDYSRKGLVRNLDVILRVEDERTEYERLMTRLSAFLKESGATLREIAGSPEQLRFTAGELDIDLTHLNILASARLLVEEEKRLSQELLYGIGRQGIPLSWGELYRRSEDELRDAIAKSTEARIIRQFKEEKINQLLRLIEKLSTAYMLGKEEESELSVMLRNALPRKEQRIAFLKAVRSFRGTPREFWHKYLPSRPEFKNRPQLISKLLLTQQLTLLTGNHQPLVRELQVNRKINTVDRLLDLEADEWLEVIGKTGVPQFIPGGSEEERKKIYADYIQTLLSVAFPTQRIARMIRKKELPVKSGRVAKHISTFLTKNKDFDFASSRIHRFEERIKEIAGDRFEETRDEMLKLQRVYQIDPTLRTTRVLLENNLHSAYSIARVPRKSFIEAYSRELGGEEVAFAVHQRASLIAQRVEMNALYLRDFTHGTTPGILRDFFNSEEVRALIEEQVPGYAELFGSPDLCECKHCRSVYSPAAYFVDLLRFLEGGKKNEEGKTPLDMLTKRRPDLVHLPLTCENTHTLIPYVDLVNEIMEYYVANSSLNDFKGYDTGNAPAEELRAVPRNFQLEAYRRLKDEKYPCNLPYHQPLDVIRTYSEHLGISRWEVMKAVNPEPDETARKMIEAEVLNLSPEEYSILTGETSEEAGEDLSNVPEFLKKTGLSYTDVVELVKTNFINPYRFTLDFLERVFSSAPMDAKSFYAKLSRIAEGTLDPAEDADITSLLTAYNEANGVNITAGEFGRWVAEHFRRFQQVVTLYEPESRCSLDSTRIKTLRSIYEDLPTSGVAEDTWSKMLRFLRLRRKLGWSIRELDLMLSALREQDITPETVHKLSWVVLLEKETGLPVDRLATLWGNVDKSLYRKLFLNRALQEAEEVFAPDKWGSYLQDETRTLNDYRPAILAAFRITEEELNAVLEVANIEDRLSLPNLSAIYRHVILAKALGVKVTELCRIIKVFRAAPFRSPRDTYEFYKLVSSIRDLGFRASGLEYIFEGKASPDSGTGLDREKILQGARSIREALATIDRDHPDTPESPLTPQVVASKLSLTFQPEAVSRFMEIVENTAVFYTSTDDNLDIEIPPDLAGKYTYIKGSGRLICRGVMSDDERDRLRNLSNATANFKRAVGELYEAPEVFLRENFGTILGDLPQAYRILLDHPAQDVPANLEEKLTYVYRQFVPLLKRKLRREEVGKRIAELTGLSQEATTLLIEEDVDRIAGDLSTGGFSAEYLSEGSTSPLRRIDETVDFSWGSTAPDPSVSVDNFRGRWQSYIVPPASGEYTLEVRVEGKNDTFRLYLDDERILEKSSSDSSTSKEYVVQLNASKMYLLRLEYAKGSENAGVKLLWRSSTRAPETIPPSHAYPADTVNSFVEQVTLLHRAAEFITGFQLGEAEIEHFIRFRENFGNISFRELEPEHWRRVCNYVNLRNSVPQDQATLTEVFTLSNRENPPPSIDDLIEKLHLATAWDRKSIEFLVKNRFNLSVSDFKNEEKLLWLHGIMQISSKTGILAETIAEWGKVETDFDKLHSTAQLIKGAVKAKYEEEDWLKIAAELNNRIRENQKQALISYLVPRTDVRDADGLFEYFLIDVNMKPCMETSRIVQAIAAVQLFVNRCLLNLEKDVSPDAIDRDRWEWMKNYRVWEANRKVFLYPENWLEPEWRRNKSEFFKELESYLTQNDITERTVEEAFRSYLRNLNEVANLDVCGMCKEEDEEGELKYLHVFARTHNAPYKFFYRRWDARYKKWSPWEKVGVDIRVTEEGDRSGVHFVPVVWKNRLFLFWPEFIEKQKTPEGNSNQSVRELADKNVSTLEAQEYWEVRLAWSEYVDGKWSPKQVTKEFIEITPDSSINKKDLLFYASIEGSILCIKIISISLFPIPIPYKFKNYWGCFRLSDIQGKIQAVSERGMVVNDPRYKPFFSKREVRKAPAPLTLGGKKYLKENTSHTLLPVSELGQMDITPGYPFFFSDAKRTYFVRPSDMRLVFWIKRPEDVIVAFPGLSYRDPLKPELREDFAVSPEWEPSFTPEEYVEITGPVFNTQPVSYTESPPTASREVKAVPSSGYAIMKPISSVRKPLREFEVVYKGLEFHTFYHPYSNSYVERLNQGGISGLLSSDTELPSDNGSTFESSYSPEIKPGYVHKPPDFDRRTYYKENVCFDPYGANSLYNWELFFHAPLYIATRLSKNGKYEEAVKWFHYIFDPTTDEKPDPDNPTARYWKVLPFRTTPRESLEEWFRKLNRETDPSSPDYSSDSQLKEIVEEWRDNPFDPHLVAGNRPVSYMKHVVFKYVENLIEWGDSLFRQFTRESVNEALQIYVLAKHILGPRPQSVPERGEIKPESYQSLKDRWDAFSNAMVALENVFPYSGDVNASSTNTGPALLGMGSALYFCIPPNEELLKYWDTVEDRLFKIRNCMDIEGVERKLALFAPPISPALLIQAMAKGLNLGSILADLSSPPPLYRFSYLIQKANEFCQDVRAFGSTLLSALEKRDAEELSRLRASHETSMLELMTAIKERQLLDAKAYKESLLRARETAVFRLKHYLSLLGIEDLTIPEPPSLDATLTADSQLPPDTAIPEFKTDVDDSLVAGGERGVKLIGREAAEIRLTQEASQFMVLSREAEIVAGFMGLIPRFDAHGAPVGVGASSGFGGRELGWFAQAVANRLSTISQISSTNAAKAARMASYIRREQEWTLQANLAAKEIIQLDKQIVSADIRIQVAEKELENHKKQIEKAKEVENFLKDKFTGQELYHWMKEQLFAVFKQAYNLAYDMAKKAEKAYKYELGKETADFIQYGYWENTKQGLLAGERLQVALRQLEKSYLEENRRELELTKNVSLAMLNPLALIQLRETGSCYFSLPEELFDLDFQGHYFRRIKSVSVSIPCVAGPYTTVSCTLRLLRNSVRVNTRMNSQGKYEHENDGGVWIDDNRFRTVNAPITSIATTTGQNDAGVFEFSFRDERYLPFEGAGVISDWQMELTTDEDLRQFDYSTIPDVILHIRYTAREGGGTFRDKVIEHLRDFLGSNQPLVRMLSLKNEFPAEWHRFLYSTEGEDPVIRFVVGRERFPFIAQRRNIKVSRIDVFVRCTQTDNLNLILSYTRADDTPVSSQGIEMAKSPEYGSLHRATVNTNDAGVNLDELDITKEMSLRVNCAAGSVEDVFLILHYSLQFD